MPAAKGGAQSLPFLFVRSFKRSAGFPTGAKLGTSGNWPCSSDDGGNRQGAVFDFLRSGKIVARKA
jgi:hypothetical protein